MSAFLPLGLSNRVTILIDFALRYRKSSTSYGNSTVSSGEVKIIKDLDTSVEGRDILIIEDIIDFDDFDFSGRNRGISVA
jgi:hypothetical protein